MARQNEQSWMYTFLHHITSSTMHSPNPPQKATQSRLIYSPNPQMKQAKVHLLPCFVMEGFGLQVMLFHMTLCSFASHMVCCKFEFGFELKLGFDNVWPSGAATTAAGMHGSLHCYTRRVIATCALDGLDTCWLVLSTSYVNGHCCPLRGLHDHLQEMGRAHAVLVTAGEKWQYAPLAHSLAQAGILTCVIQYSLYPKALVPQMVQEVSQALTWTFDNITKHGGDPNRVKLVLTAACYIVGKHHCLCSRICIRCCCKHVSVAVADICCMTAYPASPQNHRQLPIHHDICA